MKAWFLSLYRKGKSAYARLAEKKYTTISGTLVFFLIMSLIPFLFWLFLLFGKFSLDTEEILQLEIFGGFKDLLLYFKRSAEAATSGVSFTLLLTTLYSSTNLFYHMRRSGEIIYSDAKRKGGWHIRFSALVLLFVMMLVFVAAAAVLLFGTRLLRRFFPRTVSEVLVYLLLFGIAFLLLVLLNFYICPYRLRWREILPGCLLSIVLWIVGSFGFTVYLKFANPGKLYGTIAAFIVFLLWLYMMTVCFIIGVILNEERLKRGDVVHKKF